MPTVTNHSHRTPPVTTPNVPPDGRTRDRSPDSSLGLLRRGYRFIGDQCDRYGVDAFETRLMLRRAICMRGRAAAELFYDPKLFARRGAAPRRVRKTLLGTGGVQGLDGADHRRRKQALMSLMEPAHIAELDRLFARLWRDRIVQWGANGQVNLYDEVGRMLCRAVCDWAGVPLASDSVVRRTDQLHAMIEAPAAIGPRHWRGRMARRAVDHWIESLVRQVRQGRLRPRPGSALQVMSWVREPSGRLLDAHAAAVDVINILRPTVAVDRFVVFAALALHDNPQWIDRLRDDPSWVEPFVQEVRRFYPFFPAATAKARADFEWAGVHFTPGTRVLLDLYGTNHHPALWDHPERFRPERFRDFTGDEFTFIPQGGGDHHQGHRCAGESITVTLMKTAVTALTNWMTYRVPPQDLSYSLRRVPAIPRSRMLIADVEPADS